MHGGLCEAKNTSRSRDANNPAKYLITAGEWDRLKEEGREQKFVGTFLHRHPDFQKKGDIHDIALVRINGTFNFTKYVQPACFPTQVGIYLVTSNSS